VIDFKNPSYLKLQEIPAVEAHSLVAMMLVDGESLFAAFKTTRDHVVFTNKRVIAVNVQGMTGKKKDYTSLPYSKVQAFSVETAGMMDLDCELELWFSSVGNVRFEFKSRFDILSFNKLLSGYIL
jgi:hypothetical protein